MKHFVSASCAGELCSVCKAPSTHKLGEEIMHDEPCMLCGERFVSDVVDPDRAQDSQENCPSFFHFAGPGSQRHNLTAYVCCHHFTMIVGKASGCPNETP